MVSSSLKTLGGFFRPPCRRYPLIRKMSARLPRPITVQAALSAEDLVHVRDCALLSNDSAGKSLLVLVSIEIGIWY